MADLGYEIQQQIIKPTSMNTNTEVEFKAADKIIANRYLVKPDGTVTDEKTKLMWMQFPLQGRFTFDEAPQAAKNLNDTGGFAGYCNWRMPKKSELVSLVVEDCCPSICQEAFPNTPSTRFWTSTPNKVGTTDAWNVNFLIGSVSSNFRIYPNAVRLVRKIYKPNDLITALDSYELTNTLKEGSMVRGVVKNITTYGVFIEIKPGIQGLVHVSEMDLTNINIKPSEILTLGIQVEAMVLKIDKDKNRISLSMRKCKLKP